MRRTGDWEAWVAFFAEGVERTANDAFAIARGLRDLALADRIRIQALGRVAGSALRVIEDLQSRPLVTIASMLGSTGLSVPAVTASMSALGGLGIVREITGRKRGRVFGYSEYLQALQA